MGKSFGALVLSAALLATAGIANGAVVVYGARDAAAGPMDPRPLSNAARDAFLGAVGAGAFTLTFEGVPLGYAPTLDFTTFQFSQVGTEPFVFVPGDSDSGVTNATSGSPLILGFNTTAGGDTFLRFTPIFGIGTAGATLSFSEPIEYFGAFVSGLGTAAGTLNAKFNNGTAQTIPVSGASGGGVQFFGFTTFGAPITSMALVLDGVTVDSRDVFSIDDVITGLQPTLRVHEPATLPLAAAALLAVGFLGLRREFWRGPSTGR